MQLGGRLPQIEASLTLNRMPPTKRTSKTRAISDRGFHAMFIRERKSTPICFCCGYRETVFSALAVSDWENDTCRRAMSALASELVPNATLRASGRLGLTGASPAARVAVFSEALFSERDVVADGALEWYVRRAY